MTELIPIQTIIRAQQGDPAAFDTLIPIAEKTVRRVMTQLAPADADDLVQNTLIRLAHSITQLSDPNAFSSWVSAIARNELRMFYRGTNRREQAQLHFSFEPFLDKSLNRDTNFTPDIRSALERLPSSQQMIIHEHYVAERSYSEIADSLDIPISAIKSRLHRARQRLKKEMNMDSIAPAIQLSKSDLESLLQATRFKEKREERAQLAGIYFDQEGFAVGTDGHHLVIRSVPALKQLTASLLVQPNTDVLQDILGQEAKMSVHMDEIQLETETDKVAFDISEASFPDYRAILPIDQPIYCKVNKAKLVNLVSEVKNALLTKEDTSSTVVVTLDLQLLKLSIASDRRTSPDSEFELSQSIAVTNPNNPLGMLKIAVNIDLLSDCVNACDGNDLMLKGIAWNKPLDFVGDHHRAMLMPIKL